MPAPPSSCRACSRSALACSSRNRPRCTTTPPMESTDTTAPASATTAGGYSTSWHSTASSSLPSASMASCCACACSSVMSSLSSSSCSCSFACWSSSLAMRLASVLVGSRRVLRARWNWYRSDAVTRGAVSTQAQPSARTCSATGASLSSARESSSAPSVRKMPLCSSANRSRRTPPPACSYASSPTKRATASRLASISSRVR
ncbi:hypothetical protein D3C71_1272580 [compost metagenome]